MNSSRLAAFRRACVLAVGKLRRPHGVHGEMIMEIMTDFPDRSPSRVQFYHPGADADPLTLIKCRSPPWRAVNDL